MNCGKSTALIQVAHNYEERGMKSVVIKPLSDTKGSGNIVSRIGVEKEADILLAQDQTVSAEIDSWMKKKGMDQIHCVLADEAQFFTSSQIDQFFDFAIFENIPVICYGLRTDFIKKGFPGSTRLLEIAHSIEELKTICRCGKKAVFNSRRIDGVPVFEGEQLSIEGGKVEYESLCAKCYYNLKEKSQR